jgi:hypothetical protein|tara:strand:+ start:1685 stop:2014 length:330 start_codon:yes stop_codon:yes gene_type:complete
MAQDFESLFETKITSGSFTNLMTSNSDDAVIGIRFANLHSGSVSVDAKITRSAKDFHLIKNAPIPAGGSLELIDGGSKVVMLNGDVLKAQASKTGSIDALVSFIDTISE